MFPNSLGQRLCTFGFGEGRGRATKDSNLNKSYLEFSGVLGGWFLMRLAQFNTKSIAAAAMTGLKTPPDIICATLEVLRA